MTDRGKLDWSVYVVTLPAAEPGRSVADIVRASIMGGAGIVQLREKGGSARDSLALGRVLHEITREAGIPLIVNDRLDLALALDAEGAHVGQDDLPADVARRLLGPGKLLGVSAAAPDEARRAVADGADYIGTGDIFGTLSKPDAGAPVGLERLTAVAKAVSVPVVAIGGITIANAAQAIEAGADGVAVISAVFSARDPEAAARQLLENVKSVKRQSL